MASIQQDPSGTFHICFRFANQRFKRSLQTMDRRKADAAAVRISENIRLVREGRMEMPVDADVPTFLLSDGKLGEKPKAICNLAMGILFDSYIASIPDDALEQTSLKTARIHAKHLARILGAGKLLRSVTTSDLQIYVTTRSKEAGHRGNVSAATIRKEIATFSALWNWAVSQDLISRPFPRKGLIFPKRSEKPPFQTVKQIERHIATHKMKKDQADAMWDAAYLDTAELKEILQHIKSNARYDFIYPMALMAAHTGARRSELCRCRVSDLDLTGATITLNERKRSKSTRTTRVVPVSDQLRSELKTWLAKKPEGPFLFPDLEWEDEIHFSYSGDQYLTPDKATHHLEIVRGGSRWEKLRGWHVFRHSFISNCATQGVDQRFIDAWVGHQTDEQRRRYRHLFPDSQKAAIDSVFAG